MNQFLQGQKNTFYIVRFQKITPFSSKISKTFCAKKRVRILETLEFTIVLTFDVYDFYKSERRNMLQGVTFENVEFYSWSHRWRIKIRNHLENQIHIRMNSKKGVTDKIGYISDLFGTFLATYCNLNSYCKKKKIQVIKFKL